MHVEIPLEKKLKFFMAKKGSQVFITYRYFKQESRWE